MTRKKPFSAKQKKEQMKAKREKKKAKQSRRLEDIEAARRSENVGAATIVPTDQANMGVNEVDIDLMVSAAPGKVQLKPQLDPKRFKLRFARESRDEIERRKRLSRQPLQRLPQREGLEMDVDQFYRHGSALDMPIRPEWDYALPKEELLGKEEEYFREYLYQLRQSFQEEELSYFELNLETWRQLWRVLEISDVIFLVVDIRYAPLHFSPALFEYVTKTLERQVLIILNKCDLVGEPTTQAWKDYFTDKFPGVHVTTFASFKTANEGNPESRRKHKRLLRTAHGLDQLLETWKTMNLPYADQWAEHLGLRLQACKDDDTDLPDPDNFDKDEPVNNRAEADFVSPQDKELLDGMFKADGHDKQATNKTDESNDGAEHGPDDSFDIDDNCNSDADNSGEIGDEVDDDDDDRRQVRQDRLQGNFTTIGVIGQPNVGKSTIINSLVGKPTVSTSQTPGHTKHFQTHFLTDNIRLCDCPGLIFPSTVPKPLQIVAGQYPVAQVREPYTPIQYLAVRTDLVAMLRLNPVDPEENEPWSAWNICESWAEFKHYYTAKAARLDVYRAANDLLRHAVEGRIVLSVKPPGFFDKYGDQANVFGQLGTVMEDDHNPEKKPSQYVKLKAPQAPPDIGDGSASSSDESQEEPVVRNKFALLMED